LDNPNFNPNQQQNPNNAPIQYQQPQGQQPPQGYNPNIPPYQGQYPQYPNQFQPQPPKKDRLKIIKICAIGLFVSLVFLANRWIFAISILAFITFSAVLVLNLSNYVKESNFAKTGKASGAKLTGCGTSFFLLLFFTIALAISAPNTEKSVTPEVSPEPNESISTEIVSEIETDTSIVSSAKESSIVESTAESKKEKSSTSKRQEEVSKKESSKAESDITFKEEMTSQNNSSSKTSSKDNTDILSSEPIEMNSLQYLFASLNSSMRREDVNAYITNNGLMKYAFSWDSAYQIGYDYKAITERGRDREGEAVDISFDSDGMVESAKLVYHTGFNTKYRFKFENGDFWDEGLKLKNGEEAVKRYLYSRKIETSNDSKNVSKEESKIESRIEFKSESKAESKTETKDKSEKNSKFEGSSRAEFIASSKAESKSESKVQSGAPQPQLSAYEFYGNMDSMCYHTKNCQAAQKITDEHRFTYTVNAYSLYDAEQAARQYFESQGYQLCGICARQ